MTGCSEGLKVMAPTRRAKGPTRGFLFSICGEPREREESKGESHCHCPGFPKGRLGPAAPRSPVQISLGTPPFLRGQPPIRAKIDEGKTQYKECGRKQLVGRTRSGLRSNQETRKKALDKKN